MIGDVSILRGMEAKLKKQLKQRAHHLQPVILIGAQGLTPAVHAEIAVALKAHELMKLKINAGDKDARDAMIAEIVAKHDAELIQKIGHTITIFHPNEEE